MPGTSLFDLTGRLALVTGSSRGIGFAIAESLAGAGATVVLNGRNQAELDRARDRMAASTGATIRTMAFDVTDVGAVEDAVDEIESTFSPIDILFNNAGIQRRLPLAEFDLAGWRAVIAGNLDSVFIVGQTVAKRMIPRGRGKIVNTCSLTSEVARPTIGPYTTSKGAVKMLTKAMCVEWAPFGIQVNGIGPGYFKTDLNKVLVENAEFDEWVRKRTPAGRWGDVSELKGVAVFLASDASSFVNGQVIYVDGGLLSGM